MAKFYSYHSFDVCRIVLAVVLSQLARSGLTEGRTISASDDLCARLPRSQICQTARRQDQPTADRGLQEVQEATSAPPSPASPVSSPEGSYCDVNEKYYYRHCRNDKKENLRERSLQFCHKYETTCFVTTIFPPLVEVVSGGTINPLDTIPVRKDGKPSERPSLLRNVYPNQAAGMQNPGIIGSQNGVMGGQGVGVGSGVGVGANQGLLGRQGGWTQPLAFLANAGSPYGNSPNGAAALQGMQGAPPLGQAPIAVAGGVSAPFFDGLRGTFVNPLSGVSSGTAINAAGLPISSMKGVSYGGMIPFGLSNMFG